MKEVILYTKDGKEVVTAIVPSFQPMPDAMYWGTRIFIWSKEYEQYREAFAYYVIETKD